MRAALLRVRPVWRHPFLLGGLLIVLSISPSWGQGTAANSQITFATTIVAPDSGPFALLSIPLAVNDCVTRFQNRQQHLISISFILEDRGGLDLSDFKPLTRDEKSGLALFAESGDQAQFFNFSEGDPTSDIPLLLEKAPTVVDLATGYLITFEPMQVGGFTQIPINSDAFPDFYIVARTSIELRHGDSFEARMLPGMITIRDRDPRVGEFNRFDLPFPSPEFSENMSTCLNVAVLPEYSKPSVFQGDIVQLYNVTKIGHRVANRSEPTTILAMDLIGAPTEEYFVREVRVSFVTVDLYAVSWLWGPPGLPGYAGEVPMPALFPYLNSPMGTGLGGRGVFPFIQTPKFLQNPTLYQTFPPPLAAPNQWGTTVFDRNNPSRAHYLTDRGLDRPRVVTPEILRGLLKDQAGGVFLFAERGGRGTPGVYEPTVDRLLLLDDDVRFEDLDVTTVPPDIINRLLPTELLRSSMSMLPVDPITGEVQLSFLLDDGPLDWLLLPGLAATLAVYGAFEPPQGLKIDPGVVDAYKVSPRDFTWDTGKYWLGLSRDLIDYLLADAAIEASDEDGDGVPDGDGIDNSTELFGRQLITGFTMVLPLSPENPTELLRVPSTDSVEANTDAPEMYIGIQTSDRLRNLDAFLPFILPGDITVGKGLDRFAAGDTDIETLPSFARVGQPRSGLARLLPEPPAEARTVTNPLIGRPRPRFYYQDLTQPGPGGNAANNNILGGPQIGSPEKAVIGIDALDYGQNCNLMFNNTAGDEGEAAFFTEATVFNTITVDFLPAPGETAFNTDIINGVTTFQGIDAALNRIVSNHQVTFYVDDDTPMGDGADNDGDGMIDEELVNLIDDDGDALIDEDCGDGDPAGTNGVFDQFDNFILPLEDYIGPVRRPVEGPNQFESRYKRAVNHGLFIPDPTDPSSPGIQIDPAADFGPLVPIAPGSGNYMARFDLHPLAIGNLPWALRDPMLRLYPLIRMPDGPFQFTSDKDTAVIDLTLPLYNFLPILMQAALPAEDGKLYLPTWGDIVAFDQAVISAIIAAAGSGTNVKQIDLPTVFAANGTPIGIVPGEGTVSLLDLRFANPSGIFSRYGLVPLITNSDGDPDGDPQGGNPPSPLFVSQSGWYVTTAEPDALMNYFNEVVQAISEGHNSFMEGLQSAIESWNEEVASYQEEYAAWQAEPAPEDGEKPEPPEPPEFDPDSLPEPSEVTIASPGDSLGLANFPPTEDLSYEYLLQIPDENIGPLRGNDLFVVLRAADTAQVGDRFQVRMRPGAITYVSYTDTNEIYSDKFPGTSSGSIVTSPIVVRSTNVPPEFSFLSPAAGNNIATDELTFEISWLATDPDNDAIINLYVDTDNSGFDGSLLVAGLTEGVDTRFVMDLPRHIPKFDPGLGYFVYARITDGINPPLYVYADGPILATDPQAGPPGEGGIVVDPRGDQVDYYKLTRGGRIFNLGEAPNLGEVVALGGTRLAIDMELSPDYAGAVVLATDARLFAVGNVGLFSDQVAADGEIIFEDNPINDPQSGIAINWARDVEVDFERATVYILDMDGDFVSLGKNPQPQLAPPVRIPGLDLYRDMELTPDGRGMYFMTFSGDVYATGSAGGGFSLGFNEDLARDMELVPAGQGVSGIAILDAFGRLYSVDGISLPPNLPEPSTEPIYRSLSRVVGTDNAYLLVEGGGRIRAATSEPLIMPRDAVVFGDEPGMVDDRVVDVETAAFNLRDIPQIVSDLLNAYAREDVNAILALTADSYLDEQGMDRTRFADSLRNMFDYLEVQSMSLAPGQQSLNISFQGSKVIVDAVVNWVFFDPQIDRFRPTDSSPLQRDAVIDGFPGESGAEPGIPFEQTIKIRDVGDGRGWSLEVWEISNTLNRPVDEFAFSELQGAQNFRRLQRLKASPGNRRLAYFAYKSRGEELEKRIRVPYHGPLGFNHLMFEYRQYIERGLYAPPTMEIMWYTGTTSQGISIVRIQMANIDGRFRITSIRMPQRMFVNTNGAALSAENTLQTGIAAGTQVTVDVPDGFSFTHGSLVPTLQPGDADLILESDTRLAVTRRTQGILNLGSNVDIFTLSPRDLLATINRLQVLTDPLDTQPNTMYSTNVVEGNSYFVILRDGRHFALLTIVDAPDPTAAAGQLTPGIIFEWVFKDNFVLPPNF